MDSLSVMGGFEQWLEQYMNFEKNPKKDALWLDTMKFLCAEFKNPQKAYKSIHVAGSKGKGSVSVLCASVLEEAGFNTGLYTSPHVSDVRERIRRASGFLSETEYETALKNFIPAADLLTAKKLDDKKPATWFELMTLFCFVCFRGCAMDWAVFETGLGGRLDATNVLVPEICALTSVELEHTEYLGNTLEMIAAEKAGIIKPGIPVCCTRQKPEVKNVFKNTAKKTGSPVYFLDEVLESLEYHAVLPSVEAANSAVVQQVSLAFKKPASANRAFFLRPLSFNLKLAGEFQAENAALAALVLKTVLPDLDEEVIETGFEKAFLPARFEITSFRGKRGGGTVVIDGCHTPNSLTGTLKSFYSRFGSGCHLLFACAADKDVETLARIIRSSACEFSRITLTVPGAVKASDYEKTRKSFESVFGSAGIQGGGIFSSPILHGSPDYKAEIHSAFECAESENKVLLAAGSFYLAAEVKNCLQSFG
ncbi:bifunctional folylpolyglutamate synthase/dihydrofolate synthase [Treponema sp. HNW]|uniref:bifunctional folylpolyglutamate synthase/dihydrofolate synthase n=1 Tax=Treponema sp. HNW TaxID=3116654 RepID=UPI003D13F44C